ncbi:MAG TPA: HIRAN domain-containing protein [Burkholderiales bacterium]|nr:HIRAN domain-containing protein [Burkholderiales bacterium]
MRRLPAALFLCAIAAASAADAVRVRIVVQVSPLAGFQYHEGRALWDRMRVGDRLTLVREPDNPHDPRAVRVEWQGHPIGYVPRAENEAVARQLDFGNRLEARIVRLTRHRDPWKRVELEIYLPI